MSQLYFCRQDGINLLFLRQNPENSIQDFCQLAVGVYGPVDEESGMILNLVDIDKALNQFIAKFENTQVIDVYSFLKKALSFFQNYFSKFQVTPEILHLRTFNGEIQWSVPWRDYDLKFTQNRKILIDENAHLEKFPATKRVRKFFVQQRGTSIELFKKFPAQELRHLWSLWENPDLLSQEMQTKRSLSGFGYYEDRLQAYRGYELSFQEFNAKAFRK